MKITCKQFEELIPFYINDELSKSLKSAFVEHLHNCPNCHIKFNMLNSIVNDLKDAYNQLMFDNPDENDRIIDIVAEDYSDDSNELNINLSAYIDNELSDDINVQIRRNIISKPALRKKIENLYNIRKLMTSSFNDEKNRLKTDFSRNIIKKIQSTKPNQSESYIQCFIFIGFVLSIVITSIIILKNLL